ncbi:NAD(+)/NADH kinase [Microbacterium esteraromaticum]|uniref:NAD(+)/NADH kinase n=1 Tax=Microbacterium esteraromaticum TaxID=57043 RepID=A0A939IRW8_9MICO|nr:diacylglycerol kinase family protein [Microbacterium esteraromaticum]MBN8206240.1 NAD(+)/NADH kinase [Microbacterium esteraromaticum]MBN8416395.1 NAD(+)/NADH kinase [Microbacterium esteraromaticum]
MAQRWGIVWNPTKIDEDELRAAVDAASPADTEILWWETTADDPGRAMASEAVDAGCDVVIAVGGDGTVRTIAEVLAQAGDDAPALGIVPQGTGNLLARNLGVPLGSVPKALDVVAAGRERRIDMGWSTTDEEETATGFLVMVGFGLDAHMLSETDDELKDKAGWLAYVEAMGRAVAAAQTVDFTIAIDGGDEQTLIGHTLLIGNCGAIQGGVTLLPDAEPDDGRLDLLLVSADNVAQWAQTLRTVVWDNGIRRLLGGGEDTVSTDSAQHLTGESIEVTLPAPVAFEIDGEEAGEVSRLHVRVQSAALRVRC